MWALCVTLFKKAFLIIGIGKALRPMPPTWGDSEVGVHKVEGRQKKVRRERRTLGHIERAEGVDKSAETGRVDRGV